VYLIPSLSFNRSWRNMRSFPCLLDNRVSEFKPWPNCIYIDWRSQLWSISIMRIFCTNDTTLRKACHLHLSRFEILCRMPARQRHLAVTRRTSNTHPLAPMTKSANTSARAPQTKVTWPSRSWTSQRSQQPGCKRWNSKCDIVEKLMITVALHCQGCKRGLT